MIGVVAGNYTEFEMWLRQNFAYLGDQTDLSKLDPTQIDDIVFVGNFRNHPMYFSDALLEFQFKVSLAKAGLDPSEADYYFEKIRDEDDTESNESSS
jgi:hypothetical protein